MGWGLSIGLHLCVLGALLIVPDRQPVGRAGSPPSQATAPADPRTAEARLHVAELLRTQQELQRIQARTQAEYRRWQSQQARNAVPAMRQTVLEAATAQRQAARAQQQAEVSRQRIEQIAQGWEQAKALPDRARLAARMEHAAAELARAQEQARQAQDRAMQAYRNGAARLDFSRETPEAGKQAIRRAFDQASQTQALARDAQSNAAQPQAALAEQIRQLRQALSEADKMNAQSRRKQSYAAMMQAQREQRPGAATQARRDPRKIAATQSEQHPAATPPPRPTAEETRQARETAAKQALDQDSRQQVILQQLNPQVAAAQHEASQAQERAHQSQAPLEQAVRQAAAATAKTPVATAKTPVAETAHPHGGTQEGGPHGAEHGAPGPEGGSAVGNPADLAQLYATAVNAERANTEAFRQIQAHSAAMAQGIPVERALDATDATAPLRPPLGTPGQPGATAEQAAALNSDQREQAHQQIAAMAALAHQMLERARPHTSLHSSAPSLARHESGGGAEVAPAMLSTGMAPSAGRVALATEEEGHAAKDLTSGGMDGARRERRAGGKWSNAPLDSVRHAVVPPPAPPIEIKAVPGRVIGQGTLGAGWMFVDSWHTIGPFPNPQRQNINKAFPPESGVDLDAAYVGKDNRVVHWKWLQTAGPMLVPNDAEEYGIYYGYTELWFDAPADLWIAIGSDDKSTLWIDDQLVWVSSDILKGWRIDEGLRKVHFKKGVNRVLFRLENGWRGVGLSLCICLKPQ